MSDTRSQSIPISKPLRLSFEEKEKEKEKISSYKIYPIPKSDLLVVLAAVSSYRSNIYIIDKEYQELAVYRFQYLIFSLEPGSIDLILCQPNNIHERTTVLIFNPHEQCITERRLDHLFLGRLCNQFHYLGDRYLFQIHKQFKMRTVQLNDDEKKYFIEEKEFDRNKIKSFSPDTGIAELFLSEDFLRLYHCDDSKKPFDIGFTPESKSICSLKEFNQEKRHLEINQVVFFEKDVFGILNSKGVMAVIEEEKTTFHSLSFLTKMRDYRVTVPSSNKMSVSGCFDITRKSNDKYDILPPRLFVKKAKGPNEINYLATYNRVTGQTTAIHLKDPFSRHHSLMHPNNCSLYEVQPHAIRMLDITTGLKHICPLEEKLSIIGFTRSDVLIMDESRSVSLHSDPYQQLVDPAKREIEKQTPLPDGVNQIIAEYYVSPHLFSVKRTPPPCLPSLSLPSPSLPKRTTQPSFFLGNFGIFAMVATTCAVAGAIIYKSTKQKKIP